MFYKAQFLVAAFEVHFPIGLSGVDREKADEACGIVRHVTGDGGIIHPEPTEPCFATKDNGAGVLGRGGTVGFIPCAIIYGVAGSCPAGLTNEVR